MNQPPRRPATGRNAPDNDELAPEAHNRSQDDAAEQAQTIAEEALGRTSRFEDADSDKPGRNGFSDSDGDSTPDLLDTMEQMVSSGRIDMGAYRGERNDDDEEDGLGEQGVDQR